MTNLKSFNYNGQVIQKRDDGYLNLTQMCLANGKLISDFLRLKTTKSYLDELASVMGIPITDLYQVFQGGDGFQGTWGHPLLALRCAQWISAKFAVWCDAHIFNLMETGSTSLDIDPLAEMRLKVELAKLEAQKETAIATSKQTDLALVQFRNTVVNTCPEVVQQKILGYSTVNHIEYRDRIIKDDDIINDGGTVTKAELCKRYGIVTRKGSPDYKRLNAIIEDAGLLNEPDAWQMSVYIQENQQLKRDYVAKLDSYFDRMPRTRYIVE